MASYRVSKRTIVGTSITVTFTVLILASWLYYFRPQRLTQLHGEEMALAVQRFREREGALETRLHPELLLPVVTEDYFPTFLEWNRVGMCEGCDRFWVITSAEVTRLRVIEYSPTHSQVRAEVEIRGHMVNSKTYERLGSYEVPSLGTATYVFVHDGDSTAWILQDMLDSRIPDLMNPSEFTLDDILLFELDIIQDQ